MLQSKKRLVGSLLFLIGASMFMLAPEQSQPIMPDQRSQDYPEMWTSLGLPELPGARITRVGSSAGGDLDYRIDMETQQSVKDVGRFFEEALAKGLFDTGQQAFGFTQGYRKEFQSGDVDIAVAAEPDPQNPSGSKIYIVIRNDLDLNTRAYNSAVKVD
ncbi:MAG: hypothetical protein P8J91_09040 [Pirellulaceae bacterium]|nr:hypothetical protein [Planctomycetaceae bacterium]MDG1808120.1 hypothetical protein [Pirellulaceae bacterium]MDG2103883.1 hypothetical protein [Pirellulaceae bacterium]